VISNKPFDRLHTSSYSVVPFWVTVTSNGSPYATVPLSVLSVMLVYCVSQGSVATCSRCGKL